MKSALELAVLLARRTGGYIEGFPLRVAIPPYIAAELTAGFTMAAYVEQRDEETTDLRRLFEAFMQEQGIPPAGTGAERPAFGWLDVASEDEGFIGSHGRAFDITVISRLDGDSTSLHQRAIETGLFESGHPVMLAPPRPPPQIATNVMVHWNGSTEQARANAFAMPLLHLAERVTVLTVVGGQEVPGPSADDILRQLQRNGIAAKPLRVNLGDRETGEAVLDAAKAEGCDLLVKGAFTRNRLRQMIFGGATSHIMEHADLPVLMAH
jgi:nucleotide-binding universal stress UspA family protein